MDGAALREHRKLAGLSQADLAARLGISRDYVGQMERGVAPVAPRTALAVKAMAPTSNGVTSRDLTTTDPLERMVEKALIEAGIEFETDRGGQGRYKLDFYLPDFDVAIEVKRFHSDRIAEQMSRAPNVVALQGLEAVRLFCDMMGKMARPATFLAGTKKSAEAEAPAP